MFEEDVEKLKAKIQKLLETNHTDQNLVSSPANSPSRQQFSPRRNTIGQLSPSQSNRNSAQTNNVKHKYLSPNNEFSEKGKVYGLVASSDDGDDVYPETEPDNHIHTIPNKKTLFVQFSDSDSSDLSEPADTNESSDSEEFPSPLRRQSFKKSSKAEEEDSLDDDDDDIGRVVYVFNHRPNTSKIVKFEKVQPLKNRLFYNPENDSDMDDSSDSDFKMPNFNIDIKRAHRKGSDTPNKTTDDPFSDENISPIRPAKAKPTPLNNKYTNEEEIHSQLSTNLSGIHSDNSKGSDFDDEKENKNQNENNDTQESDDDTKESDDDTKGSDFDDTNETNNQNGNNDTNESDFDDDKANNDVKENNDTNGSDFDDDKANNDVKENNDTNGSDFDDENESETKENKQVDPQEQIKLDQEKYGSDVYIVRGDEEAKPEEQNAEEKPVEQNTEEKPVEQNAEEKPVEQNTEEKPVEQNTEEKPVEQNTETQPEVQNKENTEEKPEEQNTEEKPEVQNKENTEEQNKDDESIVEEVKAETLTEEKGNAKITEEEEEEDQIDIPEGDISYDDDE